MTLRRLTLLVGIVLVPLSGTGAASAMGRAVVPETAAIGQTIPYYAKVSDRVATAGRPTPAGLDVAKAQGFTFVVDLRQPEEPGVAEEAAHATRIGLKRVLMPMPSDPALIPAFITQLSAVLEDRRNGRILLNCGSANRAGAAWALVRARAGVPPEQAIAEGRAAGLTSREPLVRQVLGLPPAPTR